jgi:periplasmic protein TonB
MQKYTIVFSIFVHTMAVGALIIVPALATDDLPEPRRTRAFIVVRPEMPPLVPIRSLRRDVVPSVPSRIPLAPPEGLQPETIVEPVTQPGFDLPTTLTGIPVGESLSSGDLNPPPLPPVPPREKEPVRVGGRIEPPTRLVFVEPIYPPIALAARKEGLVILEALISEDGIVREVRVLRPEPLFGQAAITAVRQWRFSPTLLNGEPVPIVMTVTVWFSLTK